MTIDAITVLVYRIPTLAPESDGTLEWDSTSVVVVQVDGDGMNGLGFTYAPSAAATLIHEILAPTILGRPNHVRARWAEMVSSVRNAGRPGVASMAIAAVDVALWDLAAKSADRPLCSLLGTARDRVALYGSGGFTSLSEDELTAQLGGWADAGFRSVKMKVGREPEADPSRVGAARSAIGPTTRLMVDANGAYSVKQAIRFAAEFAAHDVAWFEEPVSSDDLVGLRTVRDRIDAEVAAGEYGYDLAYFERMVSAGSVDVLQADVSRCAGITEWLRIAAVAAAHGMDVSGHCAQSLHAHPACAVTNVRHLEYFADHARVERILFDGVLDPVDGHLVPDQGRPGIGLELRPVDVDRFLTGAHHDSKERR